MEASSVVEDFALASAFRYVPLALDSAALQTPKTLPPPATDLPRRLNLSAGSDDSNFPLTYRASNPQTAPCFARHAFCSPPPNPFRVRLLDSLNGKERRPRSLRC
jgi:hypothetical protein